MAEVETEKKWTFNLTKLLITTRLESEPEFAGKKRKKTVLWQQVLLKMKETEPGLTFTRDDITRKFLNLMVTYRRIKKRNNTSGQGATNWEFFDLLDEIYGTRADIVVPEDILDSSILELSESEEQPAFTSKRSKRDVKEIMSDICETDKKYMEEFLQMEKEKLEIERLKIEEMKKLRELLSNMQ
ncbi:uncharacterized protein LOC129251281 [Anastrepha obliqua]|uniref:uncharacterized protein LOC129237693 n=1 Tax=Anastrepha obliqua TaxID=95512 RepID=UPI00240A3CF8|nr:uncharacterized protein LOC129237693 [Anastrepha obliqua]XP_054736796.1 uncharacterized protein LOC129243642 [Anastrepha obliqua]XP_054737115.1 uncharacterized protein LOC129243815 [Anastrepha obliqua]XP_054740028.1 uncharacterized protein LOC129245711 [Anastrepha obliqua]XP_054740779.1 uncharacterized protein LOC129246203 [Anastrepha obliqua]XP_054740782.1 uncharacterized protein LOC129246206 [Anastrepha obliqua]XP_054745281.1 uncharacterized protein LOC129249470 [Anastrepha obliqua]XP_0